MTKSETKERRTELVKVLLDIEKLKNAKAALVKQLANDFDENEQEYRNGVRTPLGLLFRKPSWVMEARPVVEL